MEAKAARPACAVTGAETEAMLGDVLLEVKNAQKEAGTRQAGLASSFYFLFFFFSKLLAEQVTAKLDFNFVVADHSQTFVLVFGDRELLP